MHKIIFAFIACTVYLNSLTAWSASPPLPDEDKYKHNGVASCATSTCHGAVRPFANTNILHNEYIQWNREDRHARAYQTLLSQESKRIAQKLGIGPPHTEAVCLDCHASNIPQKQRGTKFQVTDGIGCESCHGGSEKWLNSHAKPNTSHTDNLNKGLYPTDNAEDRARLCLSCHFGNDKKFVTHRIMGAGHPRLSFELDTFTELLPPHHVVDTDYKRRKAHQSNTKSWAIGQLTAVTMQIKQLSGQRLDQGLFPELSLFDCHSCHHRMSDLRWKPRPSQGLGPGEMRIQDSHLIMLAILLKPINSQKSSIIAQLTRKLHRASTRNAEQLRLIAKEIDTQLRGIAVQLTQHQFSSKEISAISQQIIAHGIKGYFYDYAAAEQATMAIAGLTNTLERTSGFSTQQTAALEKSIDKLYSCVENDEQYKPSCFIKQLKSFPVSTLR